MEQPACKNLRILYGRAGSGKTRLCLTEISELVREDPDGAPILLLAPEQATLQMEKELADSLGGLWRVQALSFQRLARRVLAEVGGDQKIRLSESGSHMLVTKIMLEHREELRRLAPLAASAGMAAKIARGVTELKSEGIAPADLRDLPWLPARETREKMADLTLIYERYDEALSRAAGDMADLMTEAAAGLAECEFLRAAAVWVDGFAGFSWQERLLLRALAAVAAQMTVTLSFDPAAGAEIDIFAKSRRTYDQLAALATETGLALRAVPLTAAARTDALSHLEHNLFRYPTRPFPAPLPPAAVNTRCAADPRREVEYTAATVLALAGENIAWERIAVATRDLAVYAPLLEQEFARYGIPYFTDHKRGVTGHPLAALILALLELARAPWREEALFAAIKTGFFPLALDDADRLENYCLAQGIEPWQWDLGRQFRWPDSLAPAAAAVQAALTPFFTLVRAAEREPEHYNVAALSLALYDCLERLEAARTLAVWTEEGAGEAGDVYAQTHAQIWRELTRLLDELTGILGEEAVPLTEYAAMLQSGVAAVSIGVVPPRRREVQIASLERSRLPEVDVLFLLGATEDALPPRQADDGFLDERDRLILSQAGVTLLPRGRDGYLDEMFFIYNALSKARSRLYITRPLGDGTGGEKTPSFLQARLKQLFPGLRESFAGRARRAPTVRAWNMPEPARLGAGVRRALCGDWLRASVTELERYAACPFEHFARDWLKLKERPRAEADAPAAGQLYHQALCEFGRALSEKSGRETAIDAAWCTERMDALFSQVAAQANYQAFRRNSRNQGRAERIRRVLLYVAALLGEHFRAGSFAPWALEKSFRADAAWPPLTAAQSGEPAPSPLDVSGQIDRIDLASIGGHDYLRVIDYKSSQTEFSLEQFHYGLSLQLPLYMEAALRFAADGKARPAGFLYFPVREPDVSSEEGPLAAAETAKRKKRGAAPQGALLADKTVLAAMDRNIAGGYSELLNISLSGGEDKFRGAGLLTAGQMDALRRHLRRLLAAGSENMLAGDVRINPYKLREQTACLWCRYGDICRFDSFLPEYSYNWLPKLKPGDIWRLWSEESDASGETGQNGQKG
ncbi:MAG: PD-(D/E)XK nuclease family protein [Gracilibacteraceae bacterium]|jgi:ATP-dependent helicase/nuclease subunit B|nr:PD-(D/E)XK nuclease family protein [Gracilibacteraceae bacterium]